MMMSANVRAARSAVEACLEKADEMYGLDLVAWTEITTNLKGRNAGEAARCASGRYVVRINRQYIDDNFDYIVNDTIPHEIAHLVCFANPKLGSKHDNGWKTVCRSLGGSGTRCHHNEVIYAKGTTYRYILANGETVTLSDRRHKKVQSGLTYRTKKGGRIDQYCDHKVIGIRGQRVDEHANTDRVVQRAASSQNEKTSQHPRVGTKKYHVACLFNQYKPGSRQEAIRLLMTELNMSKSGASTYHHQLKHHIK